MDKKKNNFDFSVVVLAAGNSTRMGVPKFSLRFNANFTFIEHIAQEYHDLGCKEIIIVINESGSSFINENALDFPENVKIVVNKYPDWGRFYSIKLGLMNVVNSQKVFIINVDNPFVNEDVNMRLISACNDVDYVYPVFNGGGGHPILMKENIVNDIINEEKVDFNLKEYLLQYSGKAVSVNDEKVLVNINTKEEYKRFFQNDF